MEGLIVVAVFVVLVIVTLVLGVRIVPQGSKHVVQRLGKYQKTLGPGLNIIIPYIDSVAYKVTTKDIVLDIPSQEVITRDNAVIIATTSGTASPSACGHAMTSTVTMSVSEALKSLPSRSHTIRVISPAPTAT